MKLFKYLLFISGLMTSLTVSAMALDNEGDKKTPKKPSPPVVIVNLDKKNDKPRENDQDKKKDNSRSFLYSLIGRID